MRQFRNRLISAAFGLLIAGPVCSQGLPDEMYLTPDLKMLYTGGNPSTGLYDESLIKSIFLTFPQTNYWSLLQQNYVSKTDLPATMVIDGVTYDSVGVRFKGNTSYMGTGTSQKKSFNISMDYAHPDQDIDGYSTLNLNNAFDDASFMREWFYLHQIRKHIPAAKAAFSKLYINGANWGLYPNVQQVNKDLLKEWFLTNDGTNWRADKPPGSPGGPGGGWGDGTAALNYLSPSIAPYQQYYTLKSTDQTNPWQNLVNGCSKLENPPIGSLQSVLPDSMDVDRALWFLASEIAFSDDDSYVYKGKMDYYVYYEPETHRLTPLEFDGNTVMKTNHVNWSPFYNQTNANYPLMNRLFAIPELRQRYLAHLRTIITEEMDTADCNALINQYKAMIDTIVQNDPKKLYSYAAFNTEVNVLKNFILNRRNYMLSNSEVAQVGPTVSGVGFYTNGVAWDQPTASDSVLVNANASFSSGLDKVRLYYSVGVVGNFSSTLMYDDGAHGDGSAADGVFGAWIPPVAGSKWVRYYIEAVANNTAKTVTYDPPGAEHNVYVYFVEPTASSDTSIVINEIMASNQSTAADSLGEYDDWIELFNKSAQPIDISGYALSDDSLNLDKYVFPAGTVIQPNDYLIIWADEDGAQGWNHANFKLSAAGEAVFLLDAQLNLVDKIVYGQQTTDMGFARVPNGTGPFVIQSPTFSFNNNLSSSVEEQQAEAISIDVYPNPATSEIKVHLSGGENISQLSVFDIASREVVNQKGINQTEARIDITSLQPGIYFVKVNASEAVRFIKLR
jgi:hypothetical protein